MRFAQAEPLILGFVKHYGLADKGWTVEFDRAQRRLGQCRYGDKVLSFSKPLIGANDESEVIDTILHEIAHAIAGPTAGHGPAWRKVARELGATPKATSDTAKLTDDHRYEGKCPCGQTFRKYRMPRTVRLCGRCEGRIDFLDKRVMRMLRWDRTRYVLED